MVEQETKETVQCPQWTAIKYLQYIIKEAWDHPKIIGIAHAIVPIASPLKKEDGRYWDIGRKRGKKDFITNMLDIIVGKI